jgi:hypothetical protein
LYPLSQWCRQGYDEVLKTLQTRLNAKSLIKEPLVVEPEEVIAQEEEEAAFTEYEIVQDLAENEAFIAAEEDPVEEVFTAEEEVTEEQVEEEAPVTIATHRNLRSDDSIASDENGYFYTNDEM